MDNASNNRIEAKQSKRKYFCIPESFNINISQQFFDYKITFVNSYHKNINQEGDFVLKKQF